ncbi:MAG: YbhB/YbcL family Raf kinase inhibitor-like protein [Chlorobiales bacterium]|nr:YbhB/YbcL family Raf kinase inhibitor-like protein [Chlorobiales bacterium]
MKLTIHSFENGSPIPSKYALCIPAKEGHVAFADNLNPHVSWSDLPAGTKSLALIFIDADVPSKPDDVNKEDRLVPESLPRVDFYHWVLVDIPITLSEIAEGAACKGVTPRGKAAEKTPYGVCGLNDYTGWFAGDKDMEGNYGGYDGPCPPWNDSIIHNYYFTLCAIDVPTLKLSGNFTGQMALQAMKGHIIEKVVWSGTYTLTASLLGK